MYYNLLMNTIVNMRYFNIILFWVLPFVAKSQQIFPSFLSGTWKIENKESFEKWDLLNETTLKGFSYTEKNGEILVSEYLEISKSGKKTKYFATVKGQNMGKTIAFVLTKSDSVVVFENSAHDFPQKIMYRKISDNELWVTVSDKNNKGFAYKMFRQPASLVAVDPSVMNPEYDDLLAKKLGGDDLGMKSYIWVILKTGSNTSTDKNFINECFRGHMNNIQKLVEEGKMIIAGPMGKNEKNYRGIFVLNTKTIEEARELLKGDKALAEGILEAEYFLWYGSAALPEYLPYADKIWKLKP